jgi:hypothetical protein
MISGLFLLTASGLLLYTLINLGPNGPSNRVARWIWDHLPYVLFAMGAALLLSGCSTVVQQQVQAQAASWDGNAQNSGVLGVVDGGYHVTAKFVARYNGLVKVYGHSTLKDKSPIFTPPLEQGAGLTLLPDGTYTIDKEHMADMVVLSKLNRQGFQP